MKKVLCVALVALLSACNSIVKMEGDQIVNGRLAVRVTEAWNKVSIPGNPQPYETWTQEGLTLDHLRLWAAVRDGQSLMTPPNTAANTATPPRQPTFTRDMPADQLVQLFEILYARDGSIVTMNKVEPATFVGEPGVHFEFSLTRKGDGVEMKGLGWAAVRKGELYAASFVAPKKFFFTRLAPKAASIIRTARIQG